MQALASAFAGGAFRELEWLNLGSNPIGDAGLAALAAIGEGRAAEAQDLTSLQLNWGCRRCCLAAALEVGALPVEGLCSLTTRLATPASSPSPKREKGDLPALRGLAVGQHLAGNPWLCGVQSARRSYTGYHETISDWFFLRRRGAWRVCGCFGARDGAKHKMQVWPLSIDADDAEPLTGAAHTRPPAPLRTRKAFAIRTQSSCHFYCSASQYRTCTPSPANYIATATTTSQTSSGGIHLLRPPAPQKSDFRRGCRPC